MRNILNIDTLILLVPMEVQSMTIRESFEELEMELLSPYASYSRHSRGRRRHEEECDVRTVYQRDRDRILHSKAFRRLKIKHKCFCLLRGIITATG